VTTRPSNLETRAQQTCRYCAQLRKVTPYKKGTFTYVDQPLSRCACYFHVKSNSRSFPPPSSVSQRPPAVQLNCDSSVKHCPRCLGVAQLHTQGCFDVSDERLDGFVVSFVERDRNGLLVRHVPFLRKFPLEVPTTSPLNKKRRGSRSRHVSTFLSLHTENSKTNGSRLPRRREPTDEQPRTFRAALRQH